MAHTDLASFVIPLATGQAEEMGMRLVDAELARENIGRTLRIYIDKEGGVALSDCEAFHRAIQPKLERVEYDFLEVSSPGLDRPLKTDADFARAIGTEIEVRLYRPVDKRKSFEGMLLSASPDGITIESEAQERSFSRRDVALVKPVIRFLGDEGVDEQ